jgi:hypothetical protein
LCSLTIYQIINKWEISVIWYQTMIPVRFIFSNKTQLFIHTQKTTHMCLCKYHVCVYMRH